VWCAPDRREALTRAKLGTDLLGKAGCVTPIARTYELGLELGIRARRHLHEAANTCRLLLAERLIQRLRNSRARRRLRRAAAGRARRSAAARRRRSVDAGSAL